MTAELRSFDQYWAAYVLGHWQPRARRFQALSTGVGLARLALRALREAPRRDHLRWACAATLLTWGKLIAGTMDDEIFRVSSPETSWLPPPAREWDNSPEPPTPGQPDDPVPGDFSRKWAVWQ